jgi:hypothetical protein
VIVCPACRTINEEGLEACTNCGRSLAPGPSIMGASRRTEADRPQLELPPPKQPSKWRPVIVAAVLFLVVAGFGAWRLFRPDPCRGTNFASDSFGYCLTVPEGWDAGTAQVGSVALDQFSLPTESTTVLVEAVDLAEDTGLTQFGDFVRRRDDQAGLSAGPVRSVLLDGVEAQQWDISHTSEAGDAYQLREVVVVRDEVGWRITLNDSADAFEGHAEAFDRMLESWRFS